MEIAGMQGDVRPLPSAIRSHMLFGSNSLVEPWMHFGHCHAPGGKWAEFGAIRR